MTTTEELNGKVLKSLREQTANQLGCTRCGALVQFNNHMVEQPLDCARCHKYGRLYSKGCRLKTCSRERNIDSGWREAGWPR